jgi:type IV pilus assembly protein PilV
MLGRIFVHGSARHSPKTRRLHRAEHGVILLEALIGILIFAIGVLAVVGLQAMSIKNTAEAKYRTDAALLANELISDIWITSKSLASMQGLYSSPGGTTYQTWAANVQNQMPGIPASVSLPTVAVTQGGASPTAIQVAVTINWQAPGQTAHSYTTVTQLNCTVTDAAGTACSW